MKAPTRVVEKEQSAVPHEEDVSTRPSPPPLPTYVPVPPFPEALKGTQRSEKDKDIYEIFRKCEVNIPLLDCLKKVPLYAKWFKEMLKTKKEQSKRLKKQAVKVSEQVSAIIQKKMPPKCTDPGMFTIPCTLGETVFPKAMLDLGASISVVPLSLYETLHLGPLHESDVVIQLADRSHVSPKGVVRDVLVKVGSLIFPADFYVLKMDYDASAAPILLGRPFLKTANTKIDVGSGSLTMEFDGEVVGFNIYHPEECHADSTICAIDLCGEKVQDIHGVAGKGHVPIGKVTNLQDPKTPKPQARGVRVPLEFLKGSLKSGKNAFRWRVRDKGAEFGYKDLNIEAG